MDSETNRMFLSSWKALQSGRLQVSRTDKLRTPKYAAKLEEAVASAFGKMPLLRKDRLTQQSIVSLVTAPFRRYRYVGDD